MIQKSIKEKKLYLEILRGLAILLVIFNHTDGFYLYFSNTTNRATWIWSLLCSIFCRINVPLFFMISGALLLEKDESLGELFRKRIARILLVLLIFSLFQYIIDILRGVDVPVSPVWFVRALLMGEVEETYWFLYAYLGMLLLLPFLRCLARGLSVSGFYYLLGLETVLGVVVPVVCSITGVGLCEGVFALNVNVFYMLMGYYLDHRTACSGKKRIVVAIVMVLVSVFLTSGIVVWRFITSGSYYIKDLDCFIPVLTIAVFTGVQGVCERVVMPYRIQRVFLTIGSCAFGIYLVEQPVRILFLRSYLYLCDYTVGVVACTAYVLSVFFVSLCVSFIMKKVPLLKRIL